MKIHSIVGMAKQRILVTALVLMIVLSISPGAWATTVFIDDDPAGLTTYYGGQVNPNGGSTDVLPVGDANFNVENLIASQSATMTTVVLSGGYFLGPHGDGVLGDEGDLYISTTGWHTSDQPGDVHHSTDLFTNTEQWDYVVSYTNEKVYHITSTSFNFITGTAASDLNVPGSGNIHATDRTMQAWRNGYGPSLNGSSTVKDAQVNYDEVAGTLTFIFPNLGPVDQLGFHWTMDCGNDVIEGQGTPLPEPGTLLLLGLGLAGLGIYRRRAS